MTSPGHDRPAEPERGANAAAAPPGTRVMALLRWGLVLAMALAAIGSIAVSGAWFARDGHDHAKTQYYCPMHPGVVQDHPGECPICSMTLVPKPARKADAPAAMAPAAQVYYCPMHPEVESSDPGATCAKCNGMQLVPKPAQPAAQHGVAGLSPIHLSAERIQLSGLKTAEVTRGKLGRELRAAATVATDERRLAVVQLRFAGWIETLAARQTGQRVRKGEVLASVYGPELLAVQQDFLNAARLGASAPGATPDRLQQDARRRLSLLGIADEEIGAIERAGAPLRALPVRSPVSGYVTLKNALQGAYVQPGTTLFEVADLGNVWALAEIREHELSALRVGQAATLELAAYPGESFAGKVTFIQPALDARARTLQIRSELANPELRLKPGMFGSLLLQLDGEAGLLIPSEALIDTGELQYVFVALEGGRFEPRRVTAGARGSGRVQIRAGLEAGEHVVTNANFLIDSESRLQAIGDAP